MLRCCKSKQWNERREEKAMRFPLAGALFGALLLIVPARADDKIPAPILQEILVKTSLLTFNDANLTGNYSVMHARLAKAFQEKITPERLKSEFKAFSDQKIDIGMISAMPPMVSKEALINAVRGSLELRGYFDTKPSRITYELDFLPSEGQWKLAFIDVRIRPSGGK
jgi:hypothetical protein